MHVSKLQRIQNSAARLVCSIPRFDRITPVVSFRIEFKIPVLTFKAIYGIAPFYICNLVKIQIQPHCNLRSPTELLLKPPRTKTQKTLGHRSIQIAPPGLWNKLPSNIRAISNFNLFKGRVNTLFRKALACYS